MTPLVFVHGFMGGSDQWALQEPLADGRTLVRLDLPGFGKNGDAAPINRISDFGSWALEELSARGITRFDLLGHSMGGMIVQEMIRQSPASVNRLILFATAATGTLPDRFEPIETSMQRARDDGAEATARRISATWFLHGEADPEYPPCAAVAETASLDAILAGLEAMRDWSAEEHLSKIDAETLVIWGDQDRTYAWPQIEQLWKEIPNSHLAVVPKAAHAVHAERPALFNALVRDFLS